MKTAISIPSDIFKSAEKLAKRLGLSRSKLYTKAIKSYLDRHEGAKITEKLNQVYSKLDSSLDPALRELQIKSMDKDGW